MIKILILFFCLITNSYALEIGLGITQFGQQPDGVWYQKPFPHTMVVTSPSVLLGYNNGTYRGGYEYIGTVRTYAVASASDPDYNTYGANAKWPLSHWYGRGSVQGLYFSRLWTINTFFLETGLFLYRPTWTVTIPDWRRIETGPSSYLQVVHNPTLNLTPILGVGYKNNNYSFVLNARQTQTRGDIWPAYYKGLSYKLEIRYNFK
jgi:hypothetical protein